METTIVAGVDINGSYTPEDIVDMFRTGRLRKLTDAGYCTQGREDGTLTFVPWTESLAFRTEHGTEKTYVSEDFAEKMREEVEAEHPIFRRTPQERKVSMAMRIASEVKRTGRVPGLSDATVKDIVGDAWKMGDPITGEAIVALAKELLESAEKANQESESHHVTREFRVS